MKLHKINKQGTIAVVIPKDVAGIYGWKEGQDIVIIPTENNAIFKLVNKSLEKGEN